MRTKLTADFVLGFKRSVHVIYKNGEVVFEGNKILHVGYEFPGEVDRTIDYGNALIGPGFIDLDALGDLDTTILEFDQPSDAKIGRVWSEKYLRAGPVEAYSAEEETFKYRYAFTQLIRNGITTVMPITSMLYRRWAESYEEFCQVAKLSAEMGIRAYLGPCYMSGLSYMKENGDIAQYYDEARGIAGLKEAIRFIADFDRSSGGRIRGFLAPDRIETQTEEVLRRTADAANELDVPVRLHCCQSVYEFNTVMDRTGKTPYEWLNSLNLLTSRMVLPHGIYLSGRPDVNEGIGDDLDLLRRSGASLVHCPVVFARSGEALNSFSSYRSMGINIAMGTDTHPADMVENIRQGLNICHIMDRGSRRSTAADFYNAATLGGAAALGRDDIGRLAPGAKADITVYDLSGFHLGPFIDPIRSMILSGTGRDFVASIIDGVEVMRDGQVAGTNELELSILANRQFRKVITSHARQAGRPAEEDKITPSTFEIVRPPN